MTKLKPARLHEILGTSTVWTDELWDQALTYLLSSVETLGALEMVKALDGVQPLTNSIHKIDYLRQFRTYPPTVLLGAFDLMRWLNQRQVEGSANSVLGIRRRID